jgi:hypothetical protein
MTATSRAEDESLGIMNVEGPLSPADTRHLQMLERRIERGLQTFREVGEALAEIRDKRLFRTTHATFESYVSDRWHMQRARAYQLMGAAEVAKVLGPSGGDLVNEGQARELVPLLHADPKLVTKAWEEVRSTGEPITAPVIRKAAARVVGNPEAPPDKPSPTGRLMAKLTAAADEYVVWQKSRPSRSDKERVKDAVQRICDLAGR